MFRPGSMIVLALLGVAMAITPAFGVDFNCREWVDTCPSAGNPCNCDQVAAPQVGGPDAAAVNAQYAATGGRAPYAWSISGGAINLATGSVTAAPQCGGPATVTATDACERQGQKPIVFTSPSPSAITGPSAYINGNFWANKNSSPTKLVAGVTFSATGGAPPYTWTSGSGFTVNSGTGYVSAVSGGGVCNSTITVRDSCGGSDTKSVTIGGAGWIHVQTDHYRTGNCYSPGSPYWRGCPADSPGHIYHCTSNNQSWPYVPFSSIPCSETPYGSDWTCSNCPSSGCYMNIYGNWTTSRTQTTKKVISYYTSFCPGNGYLFEAEEVSTYVWGCN